MPQYTHLKAFVAVEDELEAAGDKFPQFNSAHEGLAIIQEEFEELKEAVFRKGFTLEQRQKEAIQLAAMAIRFLTDLGE